jgi:hypothetical protein
MVPVVDILGCTFFYKDIASIIFFTSKVSVRTGYNAITICNGSLSVFVKYTDTKSLNNISTTIKRTVLFRQLIVP